MQGDPTSTTAGAARVSQPPISGAAPPAAQTSDPLRAMLKQPIASGADLVEEIARTARSFADNLDSGAPQLAQMVRRAAGSAESFSHDIRDKSVNELVEVTQEFARRQPALFVGAAATAGFLLARLVKAGVGEATSQGQSTTRAAGASDRPAAAARQQSAGTFHDA